jgi:hypothetical protein
LQVPDQRDCRVQNMQERFHILVTNLHAAHSRSTRPGRTHL